MAKPDLGIYQYILNEYQLNADNTVFIDDKQINLIPAANLGMKTIKFHNPNQCKSELKRIGFL